MIYQECRPIAPIVATDRKESFWQLETKRVLELHAPAEGW